MIISNAYVTDITSPQDRGKAFTYMGVVFSIGFFIGPAVGGFLAVVSYSLPSFLAAGVSLLSIILTIFLLKETVEVEEDIEFTREDFFPLQSFKKGMANPILRSIFFEFFFYIIGFTVITSTLSLFANSQLNAGPAEVGVTFMIIALVRLTFQLLIIPKLLNRFNENTLVILGLIISTSAMFSFFFVTSLPLLYFSASLFAIGGSVTRPMLTSVVSKKAQAKERGEVIGVFDSLGSITQVIGPLIGGFMIDIYYPGFLGLVAGGFVVFAILLQISLTLKEKKGEPVPIPEITPEPQ
jgi:MFS family permease